MTYSLYFDATGYDSEVATNTGYGGLLDWIADLNENEYPLLHALSAEGAAAPITEFGDELELALEVARPSDPTVLKTATNLLARIDARMETDVCLVITDGIDVEDSNESQGDLNTRGGELDQTGNNVPVN